MKTTGYDRISDFNGASGADGTFGADMSYESKTVGRKAFDETVSSVDQSLSSGNPDTVMSNVTGVNHLDNPVMNTNVGALSAGNNAGASVAQAATAETSLENLDQAIGGFKDHLNQVQGIVAEAVDQCVNADPSLGAGAAAKSFGVGSERTVASAAGAAVGGVAMGGVSAIYDLRRMARDNLSPDAERQLAVQMAQAIIQNDLNSGEPPKFNHEFLKSQMQKPDELVQVFKDLMRPASMHEEHEKMMALRSPLEDVVNEHRRGADLNEVVTSADVDSSDVAVDELNAQQIDNLSDGAPDPIGGWAAESLEMPPGQIVNAQNQTVKFEVAALLKSGNENIPTAVFVHEQPKPYEPNQGAFG